MLIYVNEKLEIDSHYSHSLMQSYDSVKHKLDIIGFFHAIILVKNSLANMTIYSSIIIIDIIAIYTLISLLTLSLFYLISAVSSNAIG